MPEETVVPRQPIHQDYSTQDDTESSEEEFFGETPSHDDTSELEFSHASTSKALLQFRFRVEDAIISNYLFGPKGNGGMEGEGEDLKEISLWGVPLLPSKGHPGTDIVLMKFLVAKRYKVREAFRMLRNTMKWRKEYKVDQILNEKFSPELQSMWFTTGVDKEGRHICYHSCRNSRELSKKFWRSDENLKEFLRWRIYCVEKEIKMLDFSPGGTSSIIHIIDMKNMARPPIQDIRWFFRKIVSMIYNNYPGVIYKSFVVNVPIWYFAFHAINLREIMKKNTQKAVFLRSPKVAKTLLKSVTPENLLARYGGLKRENDTEFSKDDKVLEFNVRANAVEHIQIPVTEAEMTITWDVTIVGSDVTYKEEFVPTDDCSYKVLLQKEKKLRTNSIRNSFYIREPGDIVITIGNGTYKKRKVFYRSTSKPCLSVYTIRQ